MYPYYVDDSGKKILGLSDKYVYGKIGSKDQADTSEDWNFYDGADGDVIPFEKGYIVSYDIYGGIGQWANCTIGGGTLLWAVRIR